ncbi:MAG: hypothetical protein RR365_14230, partial [Bacteroides sp.]
KEEFTATGDDAPQGIPLTITVTDGGYVDSNPRTRATENGYTTQFTAGDQIGLYIVMDDKIVSNNLPLTYDGSKWTGESYYTGAKKYFAYYPYQANLKGTLDPTATTATAFFANVITQWTPITNQSTYATYTAQDLMTGSSKLSIKQADGTYFLAFTMTHAMALMVIETPATKYTLQDAENNPLPDYYISGHNTQFNNFTPYNSSLNTYRYLVKPAQSGAPNLTGSYTTTNGHTKEYEVSSNIAATKYAYYKVDGGVTSKTHTLQVGDFYLSDGSFVGKDATLTAAQKSACIGLVFKVGKDASDQGDYKNMNNHKMSTIIGYVMALQNVPNANIDLGMQIEWAKMDKDFHFWVGTSTNKNDWQGYDNCQKMKEVRYPNWPITYFPAANACMQFGTASPFLRYAAPTRSSGWFLPSCGQLLYLYSIRNLLSDQIAKLKTISDNEEISGLLDFYYWSSSESQNDNDKARCVSFSDGKVYQYTKDYGNHVRSIFAF